MTEEKNPSPEPSGTPPVDAATSPASSSSAAPPASPVPPPAAEERPADWETRFKYLYADFENFRKRTERERESVRLGAEAEVLRALLPIYEAFEKARQFTRNAPASDSIRQGMELLGQEWDMFLHREGLRTIARPGGRVNAEDHDVIGHGDAPPGQADGTILEVVQQGYRFRGGLLRPAKVLIARVPTPGATPSKPAAAEPEPSH